MQVDQDKGWVTLNIHRSSKYLIQAICLKYLSCFFIMSSWYKVLSSFSNACTQKNLSAYSRKKKKCMLQHLFSWTLLLFRSNFFLLFVIAIVLIPVEKYNCFWCVCCVSEHQTLCLIIIQDQQVTFFIYYRDCMLSREWYLIAFGDTC